ncbi:Putative DMT superfamily metabolite efflux protein precursor [Salmonella enterica subsp. arizonae]|uniref:DMT superfamily metabolite efflux protein n=1 Tax=Salmonella enterica subsp. arizonae TaxID=59203 RepID=A0A379TER6_SALER|nr:Putative DMT superfamily metabolite efflux protein precursor [Salmonella enterica subsp. arizonae]
MPGSTRKLPVWLPILVLLIAMSSIQSGASLAKSLFPLVGAPGRNGASSGTGNAYSYCLFQTLAFAFCKSTAAASTVFMVCRWAG